MTTVRSAHSDEYFIACDQKFARCTGLTEANVAALQGYDWPGNVRELQNAIERAAITVTGAKLRFHPTF